MLANTSLLTRGASSIATTATTTTTTLNIYLRRKFTPPTTVIPQRRGLRISSRLCGTPFGEDPVKNFEDFKWPNQVSTFEHYKLPQELLDYEFNYPVCRDTMGIRWPGYWFKRKFVYVKEMEPELVVPDLEGFTLKPYVSYRAQDVTTQPFTAKDLFEAVYADKIIQDFDENKKQDYDVPQEEVDEARLKAMQTGADLFEEQPLDGVRAPMEYVK